MTALPDTRVLTLERQGGRLFVTLDDLARRNALSEEMISELETVLAATREDPTLHVLVLRGRDGYFCAGGNLKGAMSRSSPQSGGPDPVREENKRGGRLFRALDSHPLVTVALVDGPAMGGGFGFACCADIVIATGRAKFALSETGLGLVPAQIAPFVVARIGTAKARLLALTGVMIDGAEAERIGLVDYYHADIAGAEARLAQILDQIGTRGPVANARTKSLLLGLGANDEDALVEAAAALFVSCLRGDEAQEGIAAFIEKRRPSWAEDLS